MTNEVIAKHLSTLSKLMDLHNENSFKAKSYSIAAFQIDKLNNEIREMDRNLISKIYGVGESVSEKIVELLDTGKIKMLEDLIAATPKGVLEIMKIKGLGPKKVATLWKEMDITNPGELLYACNENRLIKFKGFGEKLQTSIQQATQFYINNQGLYLYAQVEEIVEQLQQFFKECFNADNVVVTGDFRRQCEIIEAIEFVINEDEEFIIETLKNYNGIHFKEKLEDEIHYTSNNILVKIYTCANTSFDERIFFTTGSKLFCEAFIEQFPDPEIYASDTGSDDAIFENCDMQYIPACLREDDEVIQTALENNLPEILSVNSIKGVIHNHSTYSDGAATLHEMANACIEKGFDYFVISDHSQYASYAQGLKPETIIKQHQEIDALNTQLAPFKIYKSIECDILPDGNLDYNDEILQSFDLVIASVHSVLNMDEEKAMTRLLKAIENKYINILGHLTGRLLLSRKGYPLNMNTIIDACVANNVVIELNANPRRLDIDWRWIKKALDKNILISINPDAHYTHGIDDIKYGVLAAQKAGVTASENLSSFSLQKFEEWRLQQMSKR